MRLIEALRIEASSIESEIERSKLFSHMGDRGEFRESVVARFLRPFLPPCYGLGPGEVFSSDGQQSAQIDIAIYDAVFSTVLFRNGSRHLFPAESIFGTIEVKSDLSRGELDRAFSNVASVKALKRQPADSLDILPHFRLGLGAGLSGGGDFCNPYLGIIFGYAGLRPEAVLAELGSRLIAHPDLKQSLPDFVFVREPGYMVIRHRNDLTPAPPGADFSGFRVIATGVNTLPLFFLTLNTCLGDIRLRRPDFNDMWIQVVRECFAPQGSAA